MLHKPCAPAHSSHLFEQAKQHICVNGALMSLIQDDDTVVLQLIIQQALTQQHTIRHVLDVCLRAGAVLKADGVANLHSTTYPQSSGM